MVLTGVLLFGKNPQDFEKLRSESDHGGRGGSLAAELSQSGVEWPGSPQDLRQSQRDSSKQAHMSNKQSPACAITTINNGRPTHLGRESDRSPLPVGWALGQMADVVVVRAFSTLLATVRVLRTQWHPA
jgi:hypothetical protein